MIRAKYVMCKKTGLTLNTPGREVVYKLMATGCPGLPVVNDQMEVIGVVTGFDLLRAVKEGREPETITVEKIMSGPPKTADLDTPLETLIDMMTENRSSIIPIVKGKRLVGIVSGLEILDTYVEPHHYRSFEEHGHEGYASA